MTEDWAVDVKKYVPDADDGVIAAIVRYCGIALRSRDASLVSFTDSVETDRVRENYLKKKLGLTDPDDVLDGAIRAVGQRMSGDPTRNRVTVYYLLAEHFHKLGLFRTGDAAAAEAAEAEAAPLAFVPPVTAAPPTATADVAMAAFAAAPAAVAAAPAAAAVAAANVPPPYEPDAPDSDAAASGMGQWLPIAILAFGALALLWFLTRPAKRPVVVPAPVAAVVPAVPIAPVAAPIPVGADVVEAVVNEEPMVSVYFDTAKSDISPSFVARTEALRAFLLAHPNDHLQVSGYNDPRGDAAMNAALSKKRAFAVRDALADLGVAITSITLVKPADTTGNTTGESGGDTDTLAQARRVDVTVEDGPAPAADAAPATNP